MTRIIPARVGRGVGAKGSKEQMTPPVARRHWIARRATWIAAGLMISGLLIVRFTPREIHPYAAGLIVAGGAMALIAAMYATLLLPTFIFTAKFKRELRIVTFWMWATRRGLRWMTRLDTRPLPGSHEDAWAEFLLEGPGNPFVRAEYGRRLIRFTLKALGIGIVVTTAIMLLRLYFVSLH